MPIPDTDSEPNRTLEEILPNNGRRIGREEYLDAVRDLADELGHAPSRKEMREDGKYSASPGKRLFESWSGVIEAADLESTTDVHVLSKTEYLDAVRLLAADLGQPPSSIEMNTKGKYSTAAGTRLFGDWDAVLEAAGLASVERESVVSEDAYLDAVRDLASELDRTPTTTDMQRQGRFSVTPGWRLFGSWDAVIDAAGLPEVDGETSAVSSDAYLADVQSVAESVGHPPTTEDMNEHGEYSYDTGYRLFGSWDAVLTAAEIDRDSE